MHLLNLKRRSFRKLIEELEDGCLSGSSEVVIGGMSMGASNKQVWQTVLVGVEVKEETCSQSPSKG
jgi:hypothetical protein